MTAAPPKKKLNRADFMFSQKKGEVLTKKPGDVYGIQFAIRFLEDCTVELFDHTSQIMVDKCKNTEFFLGPVKGPIFLRDCENCIVHVACGQFRCRDLKDSTVYLYASNDPVIEASSGLKFAPYDLAYPKLKEHAEAAGLDVNVNRWELVFDFSQKGASNFSQIEPEEFQLVTKQIEGFDEPAEHVFGLPSRYGGQLSDVPPESNERPGGHGGMHAFGIKTGAEAAQKQVDSTPVVEQATAEPVTIISQPSEPAVEQQQNAEFDFLTNSNQSAPSLVSQSPAVQMDWQQPTESAGFDQSQAQQQQPIDNAFSSFQSQPAATTEGDEYDDEEQMLLLQANQRRLARQQEYFQQQQDEMKAKEEKRKKAYEALQQWHQDRQNQINLRRQSNQSLEQSKIDEEARNKETTNSWDRVCANVDFTINTGAGKDMSRMKATMLSRKGDLTKQQVTKAMF